MQYAGDKPALEGHKCDLSKPAESLCLLYHVHKGQQYQHEGRKVMIRIEASELATGCCSDTVLHSYASK